MRDSPQHEWVLGTPQKEMAFEDAKMHCWECGSPDCEISDEDLYLVFIAHCRDCGAYWDFVTEVALNPPDPDEFH